MTKYQTKIPGGLLIPEGTHLMVKTKYEGYLFFQEKDNKVYTCLANTADFTALTKWNSLKHVINYFDKVWVNPTSTKPKEICTKHDTGKVRYSLLPKGVLEKVLSILEFGANKYSKDNWQQVPNARDRYYDAAMRHIQAWYYGETKDPETGESHLAHALCCLMFLLWLDIK